jgi:cytochrome b subunit of formate dehydrogenase/DnaJ-class molecular chaperone
MLNSRCRIALAAGATTLLVIAVVWAQQASPASISVQQEIAACQRCHAQTDLYGFDVRGQRKSVYVDLALFKRSVHKDLRCTHCHTDIDPTQLPHPRHTQKVKCGSCHLEERVAGAPAFTEAIFKTYADSVHGEAVARGNPDAPRCADCHGHHNILPASDPQSHVHHANIPQTCARCHSDAKLVEWNRIPKGEVLLYYERSVHGQLLKAGKNGTSSAAGKPTAVCTDCHGVHGIRRATDPNSMVARAHLPETCSRCHEGIYREWKESIHGQAVERGIKAAPVCTDCHGEHTIRSPKDPESSVYALHIVATCSSCHENQRLQRAIGLPTLRLSTYRQSYHGIMNRYGQSTVAHCASCHGAHNILPSTDPRSTVNPANLQNTCGSCHPGIGKGVALGKVHFVGTRTASPIYWFVKAAYQVAIFTTIGFFVLYMLLDLRNYRRGRPSHAVSPHRPDDPLSHQFVERLSLNERLQHLVLVVAFTLLVVSGMPVSYAESGWAQVLYSFPGSAELRGVIHRIGAVMLMVLAGWHLVWLLTPHGREQLKHLRWTRKDFSDIWQMIRCYLGRSDQKPQFGRFNWIEKFEYIAVTWGTVVMILTGLVLWFESQAFRYLPLWIWHIARLIHGYEALLAFLTIIIWHMYHVHFKPGLFPMSRVWLDGRISLRHLKEEHPLEYERLQKQTPL